MSFWGPILDWAAVVLPTFLAIVGVFVSVESPRLETQKSKNLWRGGLIVFGVLVSVITWGQQKIARETARQESLLNYVPSVALAYYNHRFNIENHGKSDLLLWGNRIDNGPKSIDAPRIIAPGSSYYIIADPFEREVLQKIGDNGDARTAFELYLSNKHEQRYLARFELWIVIKEKQITVHTQMLGLDEKDWR
jgi:hypothetical protein